MQELVEMKYEITNGSLFSGICGFELGFEAEGIKTKWFIENDKFCQTIIRKRFNNPLIYEDIKKVDFRTVQKVDIFTGGFPCQDISNAGKGAGIEGSRSSLWKYYKKAIRILLPKIALIENVSAITDRGLNVVLADLAEIGYDAEWYCISASSVGAWHKRKRVFIIAYPNLYGQHTFRQDGGKFQDNQEQNLQAISSKGIQSTPESVQDGKLEYVSDTDKEGLQRRKETKNSKDGWKDRKQFTTRQGWWATEPKLGRVADGISNRVDRIKCIGNAVVPQIAEVFAKAIKEKLLITYSTVHSRKNKQY